MQSRDVECKRHYKIERRRSNILVNCHLNDTNFIQEYLSLIIMLNSNIVRTMNIIWRPSEMAFINLVIMLLRFPGSAKSKDNVVYGLEINQTDERESPQEA